MPKTVLVLSNEPLTRRGVRSLLGEESAIGWAVGGEGPVTLPHPQVREIGPDAIVLGLSFDRSGPLELVEGLSTHAPTVVLSSEDNPWLIDRALRRGASSYVWKYDPERHLPEALSAVAAGEIFVSPGVAQPLVAHQVRPGSTPSESGLEELSDRELEVLLMFGRGYSPQRIADRLHRSPKTVYTHRRQLLGKLGLGSSEELVHFASQCFTVASSPARESISNAASRRPSSDSV